MNYGTISGDIISSTSLSGNDKRRLEESITGLLEDLTRKFSGAGFYGRLVQGDYIECAISKPQYVLRIALLLKAFIKSLELPKDKPKDKRIEHFKEHGMRLAAAVAPLDTLDTKAGIIDGEAIQLSGRAIKNMDTSYKQKVIIKSTMFFCSPDKRTEEQFTPVFALLDVLFSKSSAKQCQVIYYKLLGFNEGYIAKTLGKYQSTINQHSTAAGWHAIEKSVKYFESQIV
ncbi:MAG: fumarate hydratase [Bacteroidota bacterium]